MKQICKYRKGADICEVQPGLGVDVAGAISSGVIKDTSAVVFHNMMKDISEIGQVARDNFDIIEYDRSYSKFRKFVNDKEKEKIAQ